MYRAFIGAVASFLLSGVVYSQQGLVHKQVLDNGLTVLVMSRPHTPHVAVQLYYQVGSRDENSHEKGIAHLLEHMVFKGTKELLSEADIPAVTHKLSGSGNAHTSYDYTAYEFMLPTRYWSQALPILADCMTNCTLRQDILNAEFKTVIQELHMSEIDPGAALFAELMANAFPGHPYHYPVVGYRHDIADVQSADLHAFYKKYYTPGNATLVVVGSVDPAEVFAEAQKAFGAIPAGRIIEPKKCAHSTCLVARSSSLSIDITQPQALVAYKIPGIKDRQSLVSRVIGFVLAGGSGCRLHTKIVEQERLAHAIGYQMCDLKDYSLLIFWVVPVDASAMEQIKTHIDAELQDIAIRGISQSEFQAGRNVLRSSRADFLENNYELAQSIGSHYLATHDEQRIFTLLDALSHIDYEALCADVKMCINMYCRPSQMHSVVALPLQEADRSLWIEANEQSLQEDREILHARVRESAIDDIRYALEIETTPFTLTDVCIPQEYTLRNGLQVVAYHHPPASKVMLNLRLKTRTEHFKEPTLELYATLSHMLLRGTQTYTFQEICDALKGMGGHLSISSGVVTARMFPEDLEHMLTMMTSILSQPLFDDAHLIKVKELRKSCVRQGLKDPFALASYLLGSTLLQQEIELDEQKKLCEIDAITQEMLTDLYNTAITPHDAYIVITGNFDEQTLRNTLERTLGTWQGRVMDVPSAPVEYAPVQHAMWEYPMDREQVVIALGTHSIPQTHPDYLALELADIILFDGMDSKLFKIRQETGMFYAASGSLILSGDGHDLGVVGITTSVSPAMVDQAETLLLTMLQTSADAITDEQVERAKQVILDRSAYYYATNEAICNTLSDLKKRHKPWDDAIHQIQRYQAITAEQVRQAVRDLLAGKEFVHVRVGPCAASQDE